MDVKEKKRKRKRKEKKQKIVASFGGEEERGIMPFKMASFGTSFFFNV